MASATILWLVQLQLPPPSSPRLPAAQSAAAAREDGVAWACAEFAGVGKAEVVGVGEARAPASARSKEGDRRYILDLRTV